MTEDLPNGPDQEWARAAQDRMDLLQRKVEARDVALSEAKAKADKLVKPMKAKLRSLEIEVIELRAQLALSQKTVALIVKAVSK